MSRLIDKTGEELVFGSDFLPSIPRVDIYRSAALSVPNNTVTTVPWDTETEDALGTHDLVTNPSRITIPYAGYWDIEVSLNWAFAAGSRQTLLLKNGVLYTFISHPSIASVGAGGTLIKFNTNILLAKGDYLEVQGWQDTGGPINIAGGVNTYFRATYRGQVWEPVRQAPILQNLTMAQFAALNPASIVDGDTVDILVGNGETWRFVYRASAAAPYKWIFVGGSPWSTADLTSRNNASTNAVYIALGTCSLICPRAGDYLVTIGVQSFRAVIGAYVYTTTAVNGIAIGAGPAQMSIQASVWSGLDGVTNRINDILTGHVIEQRHADSAAGSNFTVGNRTLSIQPIRIQGP